MSEITITDLQKAQKLYQQDIVTAEKLKALQVTPNWKLIIEDGFLRDNVDNIVGSLATIDEASKQRYLSILTGIAAFKEYLLQLTNRGDEAVSNLKDTEEALNQLLGADYDQSN